MQAIVIPKYGAADVLTAQAVETPILQADQVLIQVQASSVNPVDWKIRRGQLKVLTQLPFIPGADVAGTVVAVGNQVKRFQVGNQVYAMVDPLKGGAYAEQIAVAEPHVCAKPFDLSMTDAAIVPLAGLTALQALRDRGQIQSGQQVLINGASGGVGSFAVQIAKLFGATVTGICSTKNLETVRSLGADMVIDYTKTDITRGSAKYDLIFDVVSRLSYGKCRPILTAQGIYVNTDPQPLILLQNWISQARSRLLAGTAAKTVVVQPSGEDLATLKAWIEAGGITPLRDRTYALSDIADAHRYSETGHAVGKIGLSIAAAANA